MQTYKDVHNMRDLTSKLGNDKCSFIQNIGKFKCLCQKGSLPQKKLLSYARMDLQSPLRIDKSCPALLVLKCKLMPGVIINTTVACTKQFWEFTAVVKIPKQVHNIVAFAKEAFYLIHSKL
jgi:hypothetical protein